MEIKEGKFKTPKTWNKNDICFPSRKILTQALNLGFWGGYFLFWSACFTFFFHVQLWLSDVVKDTLFYFLHECLETVDWSRKRARQEAIDLIVPDKTMTPPFPTKTVRSHDSAIMFESVDFGTDEWSPSFLFLAFPCLAANGRELRILWAWFIHHLAGGLWPALLEKHWRIISIAARCSGSAAGHKNKI